MQALSRIFVFMAASNAYMFVTGGAVPAQGEAEEETHQPAEGQRENRNPRARHAQEEEEDSAELSFWENLRRLGGLPQANSLSIKVLYYLDYQRLRR